MADVKDKKKTRLPVITDRDARNKTLLQFGHKLKFVGSRNNVHYVVWSRRYAKLVWDTTRKTILKGKGIDKETGVML